MKTAFLYSDAFLTYKLSETHPLQQRRLQMVYRLLDQFGVFAEAGGPVVWCQPNPATQEEILAIHTPEFVHAVQRAGSGETGMFLSEFGIGPGDTPAFPGMYEAAALYCGGSIDAARMVMSGEFDAVFNVAGGLHHAHPTHASGFCTFNDCAMAVRELQKGGCTKVVYVDIDAHHGDGVQACFYDDPSVLTISLHESGKFLYPGTGFPREIGAGAGAGTSVNLPFYPQTTDDIWHSAFDAVVPDVINRFAPDAFVLQLGADSHHGDPLAHLQKTTHGQMLAVEKLLALSAGKPLVVTGGGGYNIKTVARFWTMVTARLAEITLPDLIPETYASEYGIFRLHDQEAPQLDPQTRADATTYATSQVSEMRDLLSL